MFFVEEAVCPAWQTCGLAVRNDEVIHNIHGWWLRDRDVSAKGCCPSAGCGMSCAEDLMASLCGAGECHPGEQSAAACSQAEQQSSPPLNSLQLTGAEEHPSSSAL